MRRRGEELRDSLGRTWAGSKAALLKAGYQAAWEGPKRHLTGYSKSMAVNDFGACDACGSLRQMNAWKA